VTNIAIVGTQWGDEGKGKIVDLLADSADIVVRFRAATMPATPWWSTASSSSAIWSHPGILQGKTCLIGNGVVVDPEVLLEEIDYLRGKLGIDTGPDNLKISEKAHVIMPYHQAIDNAREKKKGDKKIGTTGRGIGPCYEDKATRRGSASWNCWIRNCFRERLRTILEEKNFYLEKYLKAEPLDRTPSWPSYTGFADRLRPLSATSRWTSTRPSKAAPGAFRRRPGHPSRYRPRHLPVCHLLQHRGRQRLQRRRRRPGLPFRVLGIVKAYTTRVGAGPFPTELFDAIGDAIQKKGAEFGATTGRRRRCGWLDVVLLRNAARLNGLTGLAITKLDVLGGQDTLKICNAYRYAAPGT
jgi:adenylosuccinate synthase